MKINQPGARNHKKIKKQIFGKQQINQEKHIHQKLVDNSLVAHIKTMENGPLG